MKHLFCLLFVVFSFQLTSGQNNSKLDSLFLELKSVKTDTGKVMLYYRISHELQFMDINKSVEYAEMAIIEARRLKFNKGIAYSLVQLGNIEQTKAEYSKAEELNLQALELMEKINDKAGEAICYNNLGIISHSRNDYSKGLEFYRKSLSLNKELGRSSGEAVSLFCIGTVYENMAQYDSALRYYFKAQQISEKINDDKLRAYALVSLANVYYYMQDYLKAFDYNIEASEIYSRTGNKLGLIKVYSSLGQLAALRDSLDRAVWFYKKSLQVSEEIMSKNDISNALFALARVYEQRGLIDTAFSNYQRAYSNYISEGNSENAAFSLIAMARIEKLKGNFEKSEKLLTEASELAEKIGAPNLLQDVYYEAALTFSARNDFKSAFLYLQKYDDIKDSVMSIEKQNQILDLQTRYETEKSEKENEILKQEQKILQITRDFLLGGALMLAITAFFILRSLIIKKRDNKLLQKQKEEINRQKEIVEGQKKEITDSIHYARRIQSAILPSEEIIRNLSNELFVLYLPRDIVSGDFYLIRHLDTEITIVSAADCTGHGVPGAFMSMLGVSLLNDIINSNKELIISRDFTPADILNSLRYRVKSALSQTGREGEAKDGMDMSLCVFNRRTMEMQYAGANNSVYIVSGGKLTEIKSVRNPIGIYIAEKEFVNNFIILKPDSIVYLFSDGYSDQINPAGSKFLSKNLKLMLEEIYNLPLAEQESILLRKHQDFRGTEEQVDDILLMGVRI